MSPLSDQSALAEQCAIRLSDVAPEVLLDAQKLLRAFAPTLARRNVPMPWAEFEQMGLADYQREYGYPILPRTWRRTFNQIINRAKALRLEHFEDLRLFLPAQPKRRAVPIPDSAGAAVPNDFRALRDRINGFKDVARPTAQEQELLWADALQLHTEQVQAGGRPKRVKRALVEFLLSYAPFWGGSYRAIDEKLKRRLDRLAQCGNPAQAVRDQRSEQSGFFRCPELPKPDFDLLAVYASKYGPGGLDQAWKELKAASRLSEATLNHYPNSAHCPKAIRKTVGHHIAILKDYLRGPKAVEADGPYRNRIPSTEPYDFDTCDDMTMVNVWWEETPSGIWCGQGQLLPWVDERSFFVFNFALITAPGYSSFAIRNSWTNKAAEWGLPRIGLALECGIWKTSRLLKGRPQNEVSIWRGRTANSRFDADGGQEAVPLEESEIGLRKLGLTFRHYTTPRGKIIEGIFGKAQNYFQSLPGYVGRNPLTDQYERVQKQLALIRAGKDHPAQFFLEKKEMVAKLQERFHALNIAPKFGKHHRGRSPKDLLMESHEKNPPIQIGPEHRYLLATNKIPVIPGRNGISFRFGKQQFNYKSAETGQYRGRELFGLFSAERPDLLHVTDLKNNYLFSVGLETSVKSYNPDPGTMEQSGRENAAHLSYHKDMFNSLRPLYEKEFGIAASRRLIIDAKTARTSQAIRKKEAELQTERQRSVSLDRAVSQLARNAGTSVELIDRSESAIKFARLMQEQEQQKQEEK